MATQKNSIPTKIFDDINNRLRWAQGSCGMLCADAELDNDDYTNAASSADHNIKEAKELVDGLYDWIREQGDSKLGAVEVVTPGAPFDDDQVQKSVSNLQQGLCSLRASAQAIYDNHEIANMDSEQVHGIARLMSREAYRLMVEFETVEKAVKGGAS